MHGVECVLVAIGWLLARVISATVNVLWDHSIVKCNSLSKMLIWP